MKGIHEMRPSIKSAIVHTPLRNRRHFDETLAYLAPVDLPDLRQLLATGLVKGDWKRAAIHKRIEELSAHPSPRAAFRG